MPGLATDRPVSRERPEVRLLLQCARPPGAPEEHDELRGEMEPDFDWDWVFETARTNSLLPLLCGYVREQFADVVPAERLADLASRYESNARRNLFLAAELLRVLDLLGGAGIPAVPFKGPVLAARAYGDLTLRQFLDLDLLLPADKLRAAIAALIDQGFEPLIDVPAHAENLFFQFECEYVVVHPKPRYLLELHWGITTKRLDFPLSFEELSEHLDTVTLCGRPVPAASVEDSLLILCVHGSRHLWRRLSWIADVAWTISREPDLDWSRLQRNAARMGGERMLGMGLVLAADLLGAGVPSAIVDAYRTDPAVATLVRWVKRDLFWKSATRLGMVERNRFQLKMLDDWKHRVSYCANWAVQPRIDDCRFLALPESLSGLYYAVRPVRLLTQSVRRLFQSGRENDESGTRNE